MMEKDKEFELKLSIRNEAISNSLNLNDFYGIYENNAFNNSGPNGNCHG